MDGLDKWKDAYRTFADMVGDEETLEVCNDFVLSHSDGQRIDHECQTYHWQKILDEQINIMIAEPLPPGILDQFGQPDLLLADLDRWRAIFAARKK